MIAAPTWSASRRARQLRPSDEATTHGSSGCDFPRPGARMTLPLLVDERYEASSELGRGGMGVVFRARDLHLEREVALKVVSKTTPTALQRFQREALIARSLSHPNLVRVLATGTDRGRPYIAYELVPGAHTLLEVLPHAGLRRRVELVRDAARALGYAHQQGVVHRDVKPENILVDLAGRVRVTDFGLASARGLTRITHEGKVIGTPVAMAPEQVRGQPACPATDVWALGVVLYHALTLRPPFEADSMPDLAHAIVAARPAAPRLHDPFIPRELEAVCLRALAVRQQDRYRDGAELARDLDRALSGTLGPLRQTYLRARARARGWLPWLCVAAAGFGLGLLVGLLR
ncbi:MAG: serine/threonine-protein kinase [Planctomycetota bacterium]